MPKLEEVCKIEIKVQQKRFGGGHMPTAHGVPSA